MKTTKAGVISMVQQLYDIIENRKAQEKVEKELKAVLKDIMGEDNFLEAGDLLVSREERSRSDLDKAAILENEGPDFVKKYLKTTQFDMVTVKPTKRGG